MLRLLLTLASQGMLRCISEGSIRKSFRRNIKQNQNTKNIMAKKQNDLPAMEGPGVAQPKIQVIEDAAEEFSKLQEKRKRIKEQEDEALDRLVAAMHIHEEKLGRNGEGYLIYKYDDMLVTLKPGNEKAKVCRLDEVEED